ncbi:MAG: hypothetical protein ACFCUE_11940 [Candidatus Bathyarchaeia archaeon]
MPMADSIMAATAQTQGCPFLPMVCTSNLKKTSNSVSSHMGIAS